MILEIKELGRNGSARRCATGCRLDLLEVPNGDTAKDWPGLPVEYLEPCLLRFAAVYKLSKREAERDRIDGDRAMKAALELLLRTGLRHPILFLGSHTPAYCWSQH